MTGRMHDQAVACEAFSGQDAGDGLRTVKLCGWGTVESTHGTFVVDEAAAEATIAAFDGHAVAVPIDVEHESLAGRGPQTGSRGAVGWIEKVFAETRRGLFAMVRWSDKGKALIRSDAFRYLSPVFVIRKDDRRVVGIHSAAVTTKPALVRAELLAASQNAGTETTAMAQETGMDVLTELAELLKIETKGNPASILAAIRDKIKGMMSGEAEAIAASVRTALGLPSEANQDAVVLALSVRATGATDRELAAMKQGERERTAHELVERVGRGKLNPNDKPAVEAAHRLALSDPALLEALFKNVAVQCPEGRTNPPSGRQMTIGRAEREYRGNVGHQKATTVKAFVSQALRDQGLVALTEDEAATLSV